MIPHVMVLSPFCLENFSPTGIFIVHKLFQSLTDYTDMYLHINRLLWVQASSKTSFSIIQSAFRVNLLVE